MKSSSDKGTARETEAGQWDAEARGEGSAVCKGAFAEGGSVRCMANCSCAPALSVILGGSPQSS